MKEAILSAALQLANLTNYKRVTRAAIAVRAGVAAGLVSYYFGDMKGLQKAMMERAVEKGILKLVAQGLANSHPVAKKAPEALRKAATAALAA